jgi:hypothetical protein
MKSSAARKNARFNTPEALRRRRALMDARREALAASLPPIPADPTPGELWQRVVVELYVPTSGRCDQHAVVIDGERVGLMGGIGIGRAVASRVQKRLNRSQRAELRD